MVFCLRDFPMSILQMSSWHSPAHVPQFQKAYIIRLTRNLKSQTSPPFRTCVIQSFTPTVGG
jgi:hypothetical protein